MNEKLKKAIKKQKAGISSLLTAVLSLIPYCNIFGFHNISIEHEINTIIASAIVIVILIILNIHKEINIAIFMGTLGTFNDKEKDINMSFSKNKREDISIRIKLNGNFQKNIEDYLIIIFPKPFIITGSTSSSDDFVKDNRVVIPINYLNNLDNKDGIVVLKYAIVTKDDCNGGNGEVEFTDSFKFNKVKQENKLFMSWG